MRAAVAAAFESFTTRFEGSLDFMYLDQLGLVTTGRGNLIDPVRAALSLPWEHADGSRATVSEVAGEWTYVKSRIDLAPRGGAVFVDVTSLRLPADAIDALDRSTMARDETALRAAIRTWDQLPADAQLGCLSMAWAMGSGYPRMFPRFIAALNAMDLTAARAQSQMAPSPGIAPRNAADDLLFANAAAVVARGLSRETLYYPQAVPAAGGAGGGGGALRAIAGVALVGGIGLAAWHLYTLHHGGTAAGHAAWTGRVRAKNAANAKTLWGNAAA